MEKFFPVILMDNRVFDLVRDFLQSFFIGIVIFELGLESLCMLLFDVHGDGQSEVDERNCWKLEKRGLFWYH